MMAVVMPLWLFARAARASKEARAALCLIVCVRVLRESALKNKPFVAACLCAAGALSRVCLRVCVH